MKRRSMALVATAVFVAAACNKNASRSTGSAGVPSGSSSSAGAAPAAAASDTPTAKAFYATRFSKKPSFVGMVAAGRSLFFDAELSASGKTSCATCHDPRFAYGPPNALSTQKGGADLKSDGLRAVPALRYTQTIPSFTEHTFDESIDESVDQGPTGGRTWDGRANSAHDQARFPLTSPFEMANESVDAVVEKVKLGPPAAQLRDVFGDDVFDEPRRATNAVLLALEVFQQDPKEFYPYSSRYDAWLRQKGTLTAAEERGRKLFDDPRKGNCAHCHFSSIRRGAFPQFTDYGFIALGVPRNPLIAANRDPKFFDLGLCGPVRTDLADHKEYCGMFRAPTLRNVALRGAFFHNGVFHRLEDVIAFYAQRETNPRRWYHSSAGAPDDLPAELVANVNREPPFDRKRGDAPALTTAEIGDMVAFLKTLTDEDLVAKQ